MAKINTSINVQSEKIPVTIYLEKRKGLRASFGSDAILVRLSRDLSNEEMQTQYEKVKKWVVKKFQSKPNLIHKYKIKNYDLSYMKVMGKKFMINVKFENRKHGKANYKNDIVKIVLPEGLEVFDQNILIKKLLSRIFGQIYKLKLEKEVIGINQKYFRKEIKSINLKYNRSNWGSCSNKSNLNFSTRLLLVPNEVRSYVIIHELAHLIEMNHSESFWKIVENVCPNYKSHENWLSKNSPLIDF